MATCPVCGVGNLKPVGAGIRPMFECSNPNCPVHRGPMTKEDIVHTVYPERDWSSSGAVCRECRDRNRPVMITAGTNYEKGGQLIPVYKCMNPECGLYNRMLHFATGKPVDEETVAAIESGRATIVPIQRRSQQPRTKKEMERTSREAHKRKVDLGKRAGRQAKMEFQERFGYMGATPMATREEADEPETLHEKMLRDAEREEAEAERRKTIAMAKARAKESVEMLKEAEEEKRKLMEQRMRTAREEARQNVEAIKWRRKQEEEEARMMREYAEEREKLQAEEAAAKRAEAERKRRDLEKDEAFLKRVRQEGRSRPKLSEKGEERMAYYNSTSMCPFCFEMAGRAHQIMIDEDGKVYCTYEFCPLHKRMTMDEFYHEINTPLGDWRKRLQEMMAKERGGPLPWEVEPVPKGYRQIPVRGESRAMPVPVKRYKAPWEVEPVPRGWKEPKPLQWEEHTIPESMRRKPKELVWEEHTIPESMRRTGNMEYLQGLVDQAVQTNRFVTEAIQGFRSTITSGEGVDFNYFKGEIRPLREMVRVAGHGLRSFRATTEGERAMIDRARNMLKVTDDEIIMFERELKGEESLHRAAGEIEGVFKGMGRKAEKDEAARAREKEALKLLDTIINSIDELNRFEKVIGGQIDKLKGSQKVHQIVESQIAIYESTFEKVREKFGKLSNVLGVAA